MDERDLKTQNKKNEEKGEKLRPFTSEKEKKK